MKTIKCLVGLVLILCVSGSAIAGETLTLTFQENFNIITGEQDDSYTGTMDIGLRKWELPNWPPSGVGFEDLIKIKQAYNDPVNGSQYPAGLIYFPGVIDMLEALPDEPLGEPGFGINAGVGPHIESATLVLQVFAYSQNPLPSTESRPVYLEVSMITPNSKMWTEEDTPIAVDGKTRSITNGRYRYYDAFNPGNSVEWLAPHLYAMRDSNPDTYTRPAAPNVPPGDQQATAGDNLPIVDFYLMNGSPWVGMETVELNVLQIVNDWIDGAYENQGFHLGMGTQSLWDGDYNLSVDIVTKEGAAGDYLDDVPLIYEDLIYAPKLVIKYYYTGVINADAGPNMGNYQLDPVKRVKPGVEITLDGSQSTPVLPDVPITEYKWSWNYDGAEYSVTSPNDQTTAQFFVMDPLADNLILVASDDIGQTGTDGARIKVTPRIPGDRNGDGCVNLTDFVILRCDM